jgi:DNA-binding transcriptional ArsR family regulator
VNIWQDVAMEDDSAAVSPAASSSADQAVRAITTVETLKALADPIRLSLLSALMRSSGELPVRSVKELAAELGEPQTKLYRHVKHLEAAGLIRAVSSRVVSGIVEQRYQACQSELIFGPGLTDDERQSPETEAAVGVLFDLFRSRFFAASRAGLLPAQTSANTETHRKVVLNVTETWVPVAKATAIRERLQAILDDLDGPSERPGADMVQVNLLVGYYSPAEPSSPADP